MRHLISINDLEIEEIQDLLLEASQIQSDLQAARQMLDRKILAALFFEPSTRTRLSFESAMIRGGGSVIHQEHVSGSSLGGKNESLADSIRVISSYADIIVLRHPDEGAAALASEVSQVPVINGGDGAHEHPTQTLCDLFTIYSKWQRFHGLRIHLHGDLRYGRTVHSLAIALHRLGAQLVVSHPDGLGLPDYVTDIFGKHVQRVDSTEAGNILNGYGSDLHVFYFAPSDRGPQWVEKPQQLLPSFKRAEKQTWLRKMMDDALSHSDVFYVTRFQVERLQSSDLARPHAVNRSTLDDARYRKAIVMHPLPRVAELSTDIDSDSRAKYFEQASAGVPVRLALMRRLLSAEWMSAGKGKPARARQGVSGLRCKNTRCVTNTQRDVEPRFIRVSDEYVKCHYCDMRSERVVQGAAHDRRDFGVTR